MLDQPLTRRQVIATISMFIFGSTAVVGVSTSVAQDSWIAFLLGFLISLPILLVYGRVAKLHPGEDLYRIFENTMGKVFGKIAILLMSWYALHLCALVMRNFSEFLMITSLTETPQIPVLAVMLVTVALLCRCGPKALGKWAIIAWPVVVGIVAITVVMSLNIYHYNHILPIFEHKFWEIAKSGFQVFSFPFTEAVLFLGIADYFDVRESPYKMYVWGAVISAIILLFITFRNLFVLGPVVMASSYFPSYMAARIIAVGEFLSRIEGSISINFMLAGNVKITLCLIVASRGFASLLNISDWKNMVFPVGLVAVGLSQILYQNTMQMYTFIFYYPYYALPFEIALPFLTWILSEVRARRKKTAMAAA